MCTQRVHEKVKKKVELKIAKQAAKNKLGDWVPEEVHGSSFWYTKATLLQQEHKIVEDAFTSLTVVAISPLTQCNAPVASDHSAGHGVGVFCAFEDAAHGIGARFVEVGGERAKCAGVTNVLK